MLSSALRTVFDQPVSNTELERPPSIAKSMQATLTERKMIDRAAKRIRLAKEEKLRPQQIYHGISSDAALTDRDVVFDIPGLFKPTFVQGKSVNTLQEWQGYVVSIDGADFTAVLADLTNPASPREEATIPIVNIDESDRGKLQKGAYFHLIIGFSRGRGGNFEKKTIIYFRRHIPKSQSAGKILTSILSQMRDNYREPSDFR